MESNKSKDKVFGLKRNVFYLGIVSLFNDFSNEMVQSVVPVFLGLLLGGQAALAIGVIEGVADALSSFMKILSGAWSDKVGRRKPFAVVGYTLSVAVRPLWMFVTSFAGAMGIRAADRFGKGLRDAPRDALVASSVEEQELGKSFGYQRAMDAFGGLLGPLVAVLAFPLLEFDFKKLFFLAFILGLPAIFSFLAVREVRTAPPTEYGKFMRENMFRTHKHFTLMIATIFVFGLGTLPVALLLFRAFELGFNVTSVPFLYLIYGLTFTLASIPLGKLSDKIGMVRVITLGFIFAISAYLLLAFTNTFVWLFAGLVFFGLYSASTDGVERALTAKLVGHELLGAGEGVLHAAVGISALFAGSIGGFLWFKFGHAAAFLYAITFAVIGLGMLLYISKKHRI
ncbi:MAG: MFS transporter [Candidatus Colwellbacteria bacterium]|nr:MFS transporter [Candidatus Colwellbacteria bacterium]